jgi:hypothetical protein
MKVKTQPAGRVPYFHQKEYTWTQCGGTCRTAKGTGAPKVAPLTVRRTWLGQMCSPKFGLRLVRSPS